MTTIQAEERGGGYPENSGDAIAWWGRCDLCGWYGHDRASKAWARRDANKHDESDEHLMNEVHKSRSARR